MAYSREILKKIPKETVKEKIKEILGECTLLFNTLEELIESSNEIIHIADYELPLISKSIPPMPPLEYRDLYKGMELLINIDKRQIVALASRKKEEMLCWVWKSRGPKPNPFLLESYSLKSYNLRIGTVNNRDLIFISYEKFEDSSFCWHARPSSLQKIYESGNYPSVDKILSLLKK